MRSWVLLVQSLMFCAAESWKLRGTRGFHASRVGCLGMCWLGSAAGKPSATFLQLQDSAYPLGGHGLFAKKKQAAAASVDVNDALYKNMDFEAQRDPGDTNAVVVEQTFDMLDTNYDDSLSRAEFIAGAIRNSPASRASLADIFEAMDADGDGSISRTEFVLAARGSKDMLGLSPAFRAADADGDGWISQDEFLFSARQFYPRDFQVSDKLIPLFHLLDTNSDGRLSRIEFLKQADGGPVLDVPKPRAKPKVQKPKAKTAKESKKSEAKAPKTVKKIDSSKNSQEEAKENTEKAADGVAPADEAKGLKRLAKSIVAETAAAVRDAIRQELGREKKPLNEPAKAALEAATAAGLPKTVAATAAAEVAAEAAAEEEESRGSPPSRIGAAAATAAFRAAKAAGLTKTEAEVRSATVASETAAKKALMTSKDIQKTAALAAKVAFAAAVESGLSPVLAAQAAAEAAGQVIAKHAESQAISPGAKKDSTHDKEAAAQAAKKALEEVQVDPKLIVDTATTAVGTAAAEEVKEAGGGPPEVADAAAKAVFRFAKDTGENSKEAVKKSAIAAGEAAVKIAVAEGRTTKEVIKTAVTAATTAMEELGNNSPSQQVDTSLEAAKKAVSAKLSPKQTLSVAAAEAATAAVEAGSKKTVSQIASLAAKSTLQAAKKMGITPTEAALPVAKAAGEAAVRSGDLRFMSTEEIVSAAAGAVQELFKEEASPEEQSIAALAAGMAAANSARDSAKKSELSAQAATHAQKAALKANLGKIRAAVAAATVAAAAFVDSNAFMEPQSQKEEVTKVALDAAKAAGMTTLQAVEASKAAAAAAISFAIPRGILAKAGKAAKKAADQQHSQKDAMEEAVTLAKLAGKAARLAGMSSQQMAAVVGTKAAAAIFDFSKTDSPAGLTHEAVKAALKASVLLSLTAEQVGAAAVYAAAGGASRSQKLFFLNTQEAAGLAAKALREVMEAAEKESQDSLVLLDTASVPSLAELVKGLSTEVKKVLSATAAGCTAEQIAQGAGLEQLQVERAAAKATQKVALELELPPPKAGTQDRKKVPNQQRSEGIAWQFGT